VAGALGLVLPLVLIDVLFVVDDSASMREEEQTLGLQLPRLARALASGDLDIDGTTEFPPPADVQLGVISPNLGLPGVPGIEHGSATGDDGLPQVPSRTATSGCGDDLGEVLGLVLRRVAHRMRNPEGG
jgi:hypothetical protein